MVALIVFGGFIEFTFWGLRESTIRTQIGHVQLHREGYAERGAAAPGNYLIEDFPSLRTLLLKIPHVEVVTARLTFAGLISTGDQTLTCKGTGVIPLSEEQLSTFEALIAGQPLTQGPPDGTVIGSELAKALGRKVGDQLTLLTTTLDGTINAMDVQLAGIGQTGSLQYDSVFVKLPLATVQRLLDTTEVETVVVLLDETEHTPTVAESIRRVIRENGLGLELRTWDQLAPFYHRVVAMYQGIFQVIKVIIAAIVLFSIANTMTMSVFERVREIGTLRAIGARRQRILALFLTEGFLLGVLGGAIGTAAGVAVALAINFSGGIAIPPPPGMSRGYVALILLDPHVIISSFVSIVAVATFSSLYPSLRAIRLNAVEALQHT
ncbi:MAG: ABC transporter permease, partial [Candidatus Methylomirabilia bacterium]